jgi:hypothetical protein
VVVGGWGGGYYIGAKQPHQRVDVASRRVYHKKVMMKRRQMARGMG